jgi:hypothetical protein
MTEISLLQYNALAELSRRDAPKVAQHLSGGAWNLTLGSALH